METRFSNTTNNSNSYISEREEADIAQLNIVDSPRSAVFNIDTLVTSTSSPRKSRRAVQKRVVQIPIKGVEGSRLKGESITPPSDSWAWRKYGQKPIKGSPYPRGYYRCSSSKGCPARKQVEKSRLDPTMLVVTYSCEHNHPWPASRNNHHNKINKGAAATNKNSIIPKPQVVAVKTDPEPETELEEKFANLGEESLITTTDEFGWFSEIDTTTTTTSSTVMESSILTGDEADVVSIFSPMREEDESLFADLGELPECSVVFRRGVFEREEELRRCTAPWCGTTT